MPGTQAALYAEIDLELSWSESALPQSARTKHVHGLHPYLGKFPPQLAEALIRRHCPDGGLVLDPFCGSGTTLVEAIGLGRDAVGCDISGFNALLAREKTREHDAAQIGAGLEGTLARAELLVAGDDAPAGVPAYLAEWYGEEARRELLAYRRAIEPGTRLGGARLARADPRGALGAPRSPRRARCGARAGARALLVPQAPAHLPADRRRAALPAALLERRRGADRGVLRVAAGGSTRRRASRRRARPRASSGRPTRS